MKHKLMGAVAVAAMLGGLLSGGAALAAERQIDVTVTNLTTDVYFAPLVIGAHDGMTHVFKAGDPASASLRLLAECGNISGVAADLAAAGADVATNPAGGPLAPGASATATLTPMKGNDHLSLAAMMVPTNDGFGGLDAAMLPEKGTATYYVNSYDAGTEANDELFSSGACHVGQPGIPADPTGMAGTGGSGVLTAEPNPVVHIHPGALGDTDPTGGVSNLSSAVHRWLNPVLKVEVMVHEGMDDMHGMGGM